MPIKRIVVGTDFSDGSDAALEVAVGMAAAFQAPLELVHVVETGVMVAPIPLGAMALVDGAELFGKIDAALTERAAKAVEKGLTCQTVSLQGHPPRMLVDHAKKVGASLIVVGTHGRTGIEHVLMGSVAERVVQRSTCPVLVIPQARGVN
jgi:nucleotide-binding universal stress UspA family protein